MQSMGIGGSLKAEVFLTECMMNKSSRKALHVLEKSIKEAEPFELQN
jgi:hypothetical protein